MNADEVLVFPAGVRTGHPFSAPIDAVTWLCNAAAGAFGPSTALGMEKWAVPLPAILRPLYPQEMPYPIPEAEDMESAPWQFSELAGWKPPTILDYDPEKIQTVPVDALTAMTAAVAVTRWRTAIGGETLQRGVFDALEKSERHAGAKILGAYEALTESTGADLVTVVNRWISAGWLDALNGPLPVVPDPTPGHVADVYFAHTAVGTVRIGIPTPTQ